MKYLVIIATLATLALSATAQAGNPSLCRSWQSAQSGSGSSFADRNGCVKAKDVFAPSLASSASHVAADEQFRLDGAGFHASSAATLSFALTGYPPYYSVQGLTNADGTFIGFISFSACADSLYPVPVTLTLTDASGVHASVGITLC